MSAISSLIRFTLPKVCKKVSVEHLDGRTYRDKKFIKIDATAWIKKYRKMLRSRGVNIGEDENIATRMKVMDMLMVQYGIHFNDALKVVGLVDRHWQQFCNSYPCGYDQFLRELSKFPVLPNQDDDPIEE
ncbi:hypothetical protein [Vibrio parahaemolyticus]|uniref:hypothetical protein n=1 Tax=Vibrio parahaemolyticus TaxID=670 RepID=UPI000812E09F|nr:hypothetical protein [Vibrio parahaemolyticus]OCP62905.1 hypothetical protein AKH04_04865 [Vibrio parahaemolyticus]